MELDSSTFFKTYEDVENYIETLKKAHTPLRIYSSLPISNYNKTLKNAEYHLNPELKYFTVTFVCKHFGTFKSRGKGVRRLKSVLQCDCKYFVKFKYERILQGFMVINKCFTHNHEIGPEYYQLYANNRRLDPEEQQQALELLNSGAKPKELRKIMQEKTSKVVLTQDLQNLRKRHRAKINFKPLTQYEKYKKVTLLSHKIAEAASELSDIDFRKNFKTLEYILECLQNKETLEVFKDNNSLQNENSYVPAVSIAEGSEPVTVLQELETVIRGVANEQEVDNRRHT